VLYLPPYSPDFNPIALAWNWIKALVRRRGPREPEARRKVIHEAVSALPAAFAPNWFRKSGVQC
jgi:transposase